MNTIKEIWVGRTFKCLDANTTFAIPEDVRKKAFYQIGKGFIDVGDGKNYCRFGGNIVEVTEENNNES